MESNIGHRKRSKILYFIEFAMMGTLLEVKLKLVCLHDAMDTWYYVCRPIFKILISCLVARRQKMRENTKYNKAFPTVGMTFFVNVQNDNFTFQLFFVRIMKIAEHQRCVI